jgi:hypothetical protein
LGWNIFSCLPRGRAKAAREELWSIEAPRMAGGQMGVSWHGDIPKWILYNGKS